MKGAIKSVVSVVSLILALVLVSQIVLAAVLYGTGVIDQKKIAAIVKVFEGELARVEEEEVPEEEVPLEIDSEKELLAAVANWRKRRAEEEAAISLQKTSALAMLRELESVKTTLDVGWGTLEAERKAFEAQRDARLAAERDEDFKASVERYVKMGDAKVTAELLYGLSDDEIMRYLRAFKTALAAEILIEIKKVDEDTGPAPQPGEFRLNRAAHLQQMLSGDQVALAASEDAYASGQ